MNIFETIQTRRSTRTFNGLHLEAPLLSQLDKLCHEASASPIAGEPEMFASVKRPVIALLPDFAADGFTGTYGVIKGARSFIAMSTGISVQERMLGGFLFEHIVLECTRAGIDTCWLGGTFGRSGFQQAFKAAAGTADVPPPSIVSPVGHRMPKTRFSERVMRRIVSADTRKPFADLFEGIAPPAELLMKQLMDGTRLEHPDNETCVALALECMRKAPSSTNSQPWRAHVARNKQERLSRVEFSCTAHDRFAACNMGIACCHFAKAVASMGLRGDFTMSDQTDSPTFLFSIRN